MTRLVIRATIAALAMGAASASVSAAGDHGIRAESIREHVRYLAADELGGRAPGSAGEELTLDYLTDVFMSLGYAPGNPTGTYLQKVPLVSTTRTTRTPFVITGADGSYRRELRGGPEYMAWTLRQRESASVENAELVFVGYGTVAPEYDWNDYKDVDVRGKILVMLVNDPPHPDESLFGGKAMTYYGRWTYKFEIAAEKGAAGAILIHNTDAAGYPWAVVENSWAGEQFDIVRADGGMSRCEIESWVQEDVATDLFAAAGRSYEDACKAAVSRDFRPYSLGLLGSLSIQNRIRSLESHNVVARLEGNDPRLREEHIIYTAHWDHLGVGNVVDGDSIYNGALDNASGVAAILEVAHAFALKHDQLKRSVLFLITTAEESGLLGAKHYVDNPLYPLNKAIANINVDGVNIWGRTQDVVVVGYGQSDLERYLEEAITTMDRYLVPDSEPEKGYYYRSDHFPFAKKGVPALYADSGIEFRERPEEWGMERRNEYVHERYHKPQDEYNRDWDLSGAVEDMEALFLVGLKLAVSDRYPRWSETSEFKRVREESLKGSR